MDNNIGRKIDGRYEITELIGIGGMADVYKAVDIMEDKTVAVKILKNEFSQDEDFKRRFRNESKAIAVLSHPNIVKIFDVGFNDHLQYIVMEYIDGITLKEYIEQQKVIKTNDAIHFTLQILRALQHAHDRGIVHRDIKPQNIMLFPDGTIKVMDFGIARFSREEGKTLSDKTVGSVHYISPEQARGDITDEKSDIYSVGIMLYEMMTGQKPFEAETPVAVALMHVQDIPKTPRQISPSIQAGLEEIIIHAIQKDTSKRYQSASEMIKDLTDFKANPQLIFGYGNNIEEPSTIFFNPLDKNGQDIDSSDDDDEEEHKPSLLVPILTGVAVTVVLVASILILMSVTSGFGKTTKEEVSMPDFIGKVYSEVFNEYRGKFEFIKVEDYSTEYGEGIVFEQDIVAGRAVIEGQKITLTVSKGAQLVEVPDVVNKSYEQAKEILEKAGFKVSKGMAFDDENTGIIAGYVLRTDPQPFTKVNYGSTITVLECQGPKTTKTEVPVVTGLKQAEAETLIRSKGLKVNTVPYNSDDEEGTVSFCEPKEGEVVSLNSTVNIYVSTGIAVERPFEIELPVNNANGAYTITAYIEGNVKGSVTLQKAQNATKFEIEVTGEGSKQPVIIEVKSDDKPTLPAVTYCNFDYDFVKGEIVGSITYTDPDAFKTAIASTQYTVPTFTGKTYSADWATQYQDQFEISKKEEFSPTVAKGIVISQSVAANTKADKGTEIVLTVSKGASTISYPVTVQNGTTNPLNYEEGQTVTITAATPATGKVFDKWTSTDSTLLFKDATNPITTFIMPGKAVTVTATFKDNVG